MAAAIVAVAPRSVAQSGQNGVASTGEQPTQVEARN